jgi:signal peptidase
MRPSALARAWSIARWVLVGAVVVFWFVALRPQGLGGPAGFVLVSGKSMLPTMHTGDLVIVHRHDRYRVGDVIAYHVPKPDPAAGAQVIHRIVGGSAEQGFVVQGDNRTAPDIWHPKHDDVIGSEWVHIPRAGKLIVWIHTPVFIAALAAFAVVLWILYSGDSEDADVVPDPVEDEADLEVGERDERERQEPPQPGQPS